MYQGNEKEQENGQEEDIPDPSVAEPGHADLLRLTASIVSSYLAKHTLAIDEIEPLLRRVLATLKAPDQVGNAGYPQEPAVPVARSVTADYIICLEDGKKLKMLKRYLMAQHGMTPEEYRAKWGLPPDYPMVARSYSRKRSAFAKKSGLGRKPKPKDEPETGPDSPTS